MTFSLLSFRGMLSPGASSATFLFAIRSSIIAVANMSGFEVFLLMVVVLRA